MGMPAAFDKWTVDLLDALPDSSERFELIDGELYVTPSPGLAHQQIVTLLAYRLVGYTLAIGSYDTIVSPSDVWREPRQDNRVQPDIYVVSRRGGALPPYPFHLRELVLAVEVASPGKPLLDYQVKRRLYLDAGVGEYWVVDGESRSITRWRAGGDPGDVLTNRIEWRPSADVEAFVLDLPSFFETALR